MRSAPEQLLDGFPLFRSRSADEARERVGQAFSPHRLAVCGGGQALEVCHNQVALRQLRINVLRYGTEVEIDPGERGDFYMLQMPLRGGARMACGRHEAVIDSQVMGVLHPRAPTRMHWSPDCTMLLVQVPSHAVDGRMIDASLRAGNGFGALTLSRRDPAVAAWWQAVLDLTHNLHQHGSYWMGQPGAQAAMEAFLLAGLPPLGAAHAEHRGDVLGGRHEACLQRARAYIHDHAHEGLTLADIAAAACVSPRTLELAFRRRYDQSPLGYARTVQLDRVHQALVSAARDGRPLRVTDAALQQGFVHMGRFAAYYKARFGCAPSDTLRQHA